MCRLRKALYGLKHAPRSWYEKIHAYLVAFGFENSPTESVLYLKHVDDVFLIMVVYVDDMLLTGPNEKHIAAFKVDLHAPNQPLLRCQIWGICIIIWAFNLCKLMVE